MYFYIGASIQPAAKRPKIEEILSEGGESLLGIPNVEMGLIGMDMVLSPAADTDGFQAELDPAVELLTHTTTYGALGLPASASSSNRPQPLAATTGAPSRRYTAPSVFQTTQIGGIIPSSHSRTQYPNIAIQQSIPRNIYNVPTRPQRRSVSAAANQQFQENPRRFSYPPQLHAAQYVNPSCAIHAGAPSQQHQPPSFEPSNGEYVLVPQQYIRVPQPTEHMYIPAIQGIVNIRYRILRFLLVHTRTRKSQQQGPYKIFLADKIPSLFDGIVRWRPRYLSGKTHL